MRKFTVVLVRNADLAARFDMSTIADRVYVALVKAPSPVQAKVQALAELAEADGDDLRALTPEDQPTCLPSTSDYEHLVTFPGHRPPALFGWQAGG